MRNAYRASNRASRFWTGKIGLKLQHVLILETFMFLTACIFLFGGAGGGNKKAIVIGLLLGAVSLIIWVRNFGRRIRILKR